jgi:hypothetical protein
MVQDSQKIDLVHKLNQSVFQAINKDILGVATQRLSSSHNAVQRMLTGYSDMLKMLMPTIISTMPSDIKWYDKVANYWHSFGREIPGGGLSLEIGLIYDIGDVDRRAFIDELVTKTSIKVDGVPTHTIKTSENLRDYVKKNIPISEQYKYGKPINTVDYLTWTYALGNREVANNPVDVDKSGNIRFALIDPRLIEETRRVNYGISLRATQKYLEILGNRQTVRDVLFVLGENPDAFTDKEIDANIKLKHISDTAPKRFIELCEDKSLATKGRIERYILAGVLRRLPNSSIIVDGQDTSLLIGNTLEEAIIYFTTEAPDKMAKVKEFSARYTLFKNQTNKT